MATDLNLCQFIGNLGADVEVRYTQSGVAVANFNVASNREWRDKNSGEKQQQTEWVRAVAFDKLAEICGEYLAKGSKVYIAGRMQTRKWTDKEGIDRYSTEVVLNQMQMLDSKPQPGNAGAQGRANNQAQNYGAASRGGAPARGAQGQAGGYPQSHGPQSQPASAGGGFVDDLDDDIPFAGVPGWAI